MDARAIVSVEDRRFWTDPGVDLRGIARAVFSDATGGSEAGGVDDRRAVRQERAVRAGQPHDLREAARGGAGLSPDSPVAQAEDPDPVPELDLLRERRLRDRIGRARLLRQGPRLQLGASRPARPAQAAATPRGRPCASVLQPYEAALLAGMVADPTRVRSRAPPPGGEGAPQPGPRGHARAGLHHRGAVPVRERPSRSRPRR